MITQKDFEKELTKLLVQISQGIKQNQKAGKKILSLELGELYAPHVADYFRKLGYVVRHSMPTMLMISVYSEEGDL